MTEQLNPGQSKANPPTHVVKIRHGNGRQTFYERIGAAWENPETGSVYVKLNGTQVVSDGFTLYRNDDPQPTTTQPE